ncbi:site-specific recombinase XerD [Hydrogenivirga caldilitoris]|uniref:Site-specific recombinase XerD n=1 Tax=Hydrogenivirga caldilitoris TaxID=246264 RepID=A0A497XR24_9AQUI|nr:site-specific integrase [Hydrogenivirga caldilitoris]RLJ70714.1 site-specific recombinase XerD [Hydrogenivirga caldilitoris]
MPRGEGYLRKRGKNWYFEFMYQGKRYYVKIGNVAKTVAREIANEIRAQVIRGEWIPPKEKNTTFKEVARKYLEWYETRSHARKKAKDIHRYRVEKLVEYFGDYQLQRISYFTVEHYKKKRLQNGVGKDTINKELTVLKSIFNRAKELGLFSGDLPKIEKFRDVENERLRYLTPEEAKKLIDTCPEWLKPAVIFALNTGLRAGEIFSLKWDQVDFKNRKIYIEPTNTKTKKIYKIPMNKTVYELLMKLKEEQKEGGIDHGYVFINSKGEPYSAEWNGYRRAFQTACRKAGIKNFRFHDLRHTFASWVAMKSKDIYAVQKLLHHSDLSMTKRYAHLTDEYLQEVVDSIDFGSISSTG